MGQTNDVRWKQRFANFQRALRKLAEAVEISRTRPLSDLETQGLIKAFEFTYELAWNVMKDYFGHQGVGPINGPRDAVREAFSNGLVVDGEGWMEMIQSRDKTSHTYNNELAESVSKAVRSAYFELLTDFQTVMAKLDDPNER